MSGDLEMPRKLKAFVVVEYSRHKRRMFYFRRGKGPRIRLPDDPTSKEFGDAYEDALTGKAAKRKRADDQPSHSLRWLVDRYMESGRWAGLSIATRKQQSLLFLDAVAKGKNPSFKGITKKTMERSMEARSSTPSLANNYLKAMRGLFRWAVKNDHIEIDPTEGVERFKVKTDGFLKWTETDVTVFCRKWPIGSKPRLAFELYLLSGLRRSDVHKIGPQHLRGSVLSLRSTKPPHHEISIHIPARVLKIIKATRTGDMAFMTKNSGLPFTSKESFGNWFGERCREAGLATGKSAHGIRKLAATLAAEGGGTTHELMAHFGWSHPAQAEVYTRGADRQKLGIRSSERVADQIVNVLPRTAVSGLGENTKKLNKINAKK